MQEQSTTDTSIRFSTSLWAAIALLLAILALGWIAGPVAQDTAYHDFADRRGMGGIPNALDVLSNLPFVIFGVYGLCLVWTRRERLEDRYPMYLVFFFGVFLTGIGSAYYHWEPNNATLMWDRLPMAISFMGFFAAIFSERINSGLGRRLFPWLVAIGIGSVLYWHWLDDLRPYIVVQFGTMLALPAILIAHRQSGDKWLWLAFGFYLLAKLLEAADVPVFALSGDLVSGHSLKHLAASLAPIMILLGLGLRLRPLQAAA